MQFNSVTSQDYTEGARAVVKNMDAIFNINRETSPDITAQAQQVIESRSLERQTANKAIKDVKLQREYSKAQNKVEKIKIKTEKDVADIKRPAKRMAGITAALGSLTEAYGYGVERRERQEANKRREERDRKNDERWAEMSKPRPTFEDVKGDYNLGDMPTDPSKKTDTGVESTVSSDNVGSNATPGKVVGGNSQPVSSGTPGKKMTKAQIKALAESVGFSPQAAGIVVGISGGESGFDPSNSTKRSGLFAKTGEDSVGLMQINWGAHKGKPFLTNLGITKREDLLDPVKNMKAAKALYDGRGGGFQDWTVYTSGKYTNYL